MKLKIWIKKNCVNICAFARKIGVSDPTIHRCMRGGVPTLEVALAIEDGTGGEVTVRDLMPAKKSKMKDLKD